jgi:hypothetical protein
MDSLAVLVTEALQRARVDAFPLLDGAVRQKVESQLEAFLDDHANFDYAPALLAWYLWPEHVLFSERAGRLAGVIDFALEARLTAPRSIGPLLGLHGHRASLLSLCKGLLERGRELLFLL